MCCRAQNHAAAERLEGVWGEQSPSPGLISHESSLPPDYLLSGAICKAASHLLKIESYLAVCVEPIAPCVPLLRCFSIFPRAQTLGKMASCWLAKGHTEVGFQWLSAVHKSRHCISCATVPTSKLLLAKCPQAQCGSGCMETVQGVAGPNLKSSNKLTQDSPKPCGHKHCTVVPRPLMVLGLVKGA